MPLNEQYLLLLQGPRPHPDEMAGSDLDGDEYFVTWEKGLIFSQSNDPAMDYSSKGYPMETNRPITTEDLIEQFIINIKTDILGEVSIAHLIHADHDKKGIWSDACLQLACIASEAVDAPKTGTTPNVPRSLRCQERPDFLGHAPSKKIYRSTHALGVMYRDIRTIINALNKHRMPSTSSFECPDDVFNAYYSDARSLLRSYKAQMDALMVKFDAKSEVQIICGSMAERRKDERYDLQAEAREAYANLAKSFREKFRRKTIELSKKKDSKKESSLHLLLACFRIVYDEKEGKNFETCRAAPWLVFPDHVPLPSYRSQPDDSDPASLSHTLRMRIPDTQKYVERIAEYFGKKTQDARTWAMPENTWLLKSIQTVLFYANVKEHELDNALAMFDKFISDQGHLQQAPVETSFWGKLVSKIWSPNTEDTRAAMSEMQKHLLQWRSLIPSQVEEAERFSSCLMEAASQLSLVCDNWPDELHTRFRDVFVTLLMNVCG